MPTERVLRFLARAAWRLEKIGTRSSKASIYQGVGVAHCSFEAPLECFSRRPTSLEEVYPDEARFGRSAAYFVLRTFAHGIYLPTSSIALRFPPKVLGSHLLR